MVGHQLLFGHCMLCTSLLVSRAPAVTGRSSVDLFVAKQAPEVVGLMSAYLCVGIARVGLVVE